MHASMRVNIPVLQRFPLTARVLLALILSFLFCPAPSMAGEKNLLDVWTEITPPPPVPIQPVHLAPESSALLILDIEEWTCNSERRPRCPDSVARIKGFLDQARSKGMKVVYSLTTKGTPQTILPGVLPLGDTPIVQSGVDKFHNTELEKILRDQAIKTVVIVGTAAEGAVLHTATGAALRGLQVVVPLDGMTSATLYAEQYTAWHLLNAPGTKGKATLTLFQLIDF
ncbi:isochorismatase family protein [Thiovibrio frasassiensis]|uniref:Cysteine hydrolase n=1 Tax=Thiovibrio frasassiensis TaxID=2984131 RepID=A0A9X4MQU3_9BACT|nr:isochorismatase family protein [Thiovibrio frasassiensis]MDG4477047.1 cysteine hydrolase [Thiovibrio frasassiensis]